MFFHVWAGLGATGNFSCLEILEMGEGLHTELHHVQHVIVEHTTDYEVVGTLLVEVSDHKERAVIFLTEKLNFSGVFKGSDVVESDGVGLLQQQDILHALLYQVSSNALLLL